MCFSATASFASGVLLTTIGTIAIKKTTSRSQIPFASIPFLFGAQQIAEGFVWVGLQQPAYNYFAIPATYLFLFFAQVVWPIWVPLSILQLQEKQQKNILQKILLGIGLIVGTYLAYCLLKYPVKSMVVGNHIYYKQEYPPRISNIGGVLYFIATVGPTFISGVKRMWLLGLAISISYFIAVVFYEDYVISVWCFFAAIISALVFVLLNRNNNNHRHNKFA